MSTRSRLLPISLVAIAALFAPSTRALDVRCVSTTGQLQNALLALEDDEVEVRLVTGTYNVTGTCLNNVNALNCESNENGFTIKGGYAAGCATRGLDPGATVITVSPGVDITIPRSTDFDDTPDRVLLQRLTVRGPRVVRPAAAVATLDAVWFDQVGGVLVDLSESLTMRSSLVTRAPEVPDVPNLESFRALRGTVLIEGNTFTGNAGPIEISGGGVVRNNIFWNNAPTDVRFLTFDDPLELSVRNNTWGSVSGLSALANPPVSTQTFNPQFVNPAALNWQLQANSPAIGTAFPSALLLSQQDFDGGPRWFGDAPDRGAFESSIGTTAPLITVTNTNDSGLGSLRQAILDANALPNVNRIEFDIGTTCGPRNIALATPLPTITNPVVIDGYTQPGAQRNTLSSNSNAVRCIGITGGGTVLNAITTGTADNVSVTLDGLGFGGFSLNAVNLTGGNGHRFIGSQIGGVIGPTATALTLAPSVNGLVVGALFGSGAAAGVEIGGESPAERNVFSDVTDAAIRLGAGAEDARVINNHIGVGPSGSMSSEGNRDGVVIAGRNNEVRRNVISNNTRYGVLVTGSDARANRIVDNRIGIEAFCDFGICSTTLGNTEDGVRFESNASDNLVDRNQIRENGGDGVVVASGVRNAILRNILLDNDEQPIDIGDNGTSANGNNTLPPPGAANFGQNRPLMTSASGPVGFGFARGTLTSANGLYRIDVYSAINCGSLFVPPAPPGEPELWLGSGFVTISNGTVTTDGSAPFSVLIASGDPGFFDPQRRIVATATRMAGTSTSGVPRSTSEVSSCVTYSVELFNDGFED